MFAFIPRAGGNKRQTAYKCSQCKILEKPRKYIKERPKQMSPFYQEPEITRGKQLTSAHSVRDLSIKERSKHISRLMYNAHYQQTGEPLQMNKLQLCLVIDYFALSLYL